MMKMMKTLICVAMLTLFCAATASASVITPSFDIGATESAALEQSMFTKYQVYKTETFETLAAGTVISGIFSSEVGPFAGIGNVYDAPTGGMFATVGSQYFSSFDGTSSSDFTFVLTTNPAQAVGFYVTSFDTSTPFYVTLNLQGAAPVFYDLTSVVTGVVDVGIPIYVAFESDTLITSVVFSNVGDAYGIDNFTAMNTPIPGAVWLFGPGLLCLLGYRRMRG